MKRNFSEFNPVKIGLAGLALLALLGLAAMNSGAIIQHFTTTTYYADLSEAGGLTSGDSVEIAGITMGTVTSVKLQGTHVLATFNVKHGGHLGKGTSATISSATALGTKDLALQTGGTGTLAPGATIPLARTTSPYDLTQVLSTLTTQAGQINAGQLSSAFNTLAGSLRNAPPSLRSALSGISALSQTIASRDSALTSLLSNASTVSGLLADRSQQVGTLMTSGTQLLSALEQRRNQIRELLVNVTAVTQQVKGLVTDNGQTLGPMLTQLQGVLNLLNNNSTQLTEAINGFERYSGSLGDAVGSGPFYYAYIANILPTNMAPLLPAVLGK
ncbi:MAG: MCE family protein [Streptosporangiales bacterium]|nr:MCE family protein [Streptosporangiales bacterium]